MKHLGDITKINGAEIEPVDCIIGGSPCQDLSTAGKRAGLAGERSGLFMEQIRIVKEMREHERRIRGTDDDFRLRPRYMVWENVPGAFSSNKGEDFQAVLTEIVRIVRPDAPDVPLPDRGGVEQVRLHHGIRCSRMPFFHRLEITRRAVLGCTPEKKTNRAYRRFWRIQRTRNII